MVIPSILGWRGACRVDMGAGSVRRVGVEQAAEGSCRQQGAPTDFDRLDAVLLDEGIDGRPTKAERLGGCHYRHGELFHFGLQCLPIRGGRRLRLHTFAGASHG